jgi:hypothetical protein
MLLEIYNTEEEVKLIATMIIILFIFVISYVKIINAGVSNRTEKRNGGLTMILIY